MDFTLKKYEELVVALKEGGYGFVPYCDFVNATGKVVCLRHDVDLKPFNSLATARVENRLGVRATYYFRAVPESWNEEVIREIAALGHEIGYHYESLTTCDGNIGRAYEDFCGNLERLRALAPVSTICMHGSPKSPYDSKDIWKTYSYKELGVTAEPYLDTDWSETFYLTDTGRRWDGYNVSVRDKIPHWQDVWNEQGLTFHATDEVIRRVGELPWKVMITTHPQRWNSAFGAWVKEMVMQTAKNVVKSVLIRLRK